MLLFVCRNFADHPECQKYLPVNPDTNDLYTKCNDGVLFWWGVHCFSWVILYNGFRCKWSLINWVNYLLTTVLFWPLKVFLKYTSGIFESMDFILVEQSTVSRALEYKWSKQCWFYIHHYRHILIAGVHWRWAKMLSCLQLAGVPSPIC